MNRKHKFRLISIIVIFTLLSIAIGLILYALKQNINLFYTPTQLIKTTLNAEQTLRLGGYVKLHSLQYDSSGQRVHFIITDRINDITVSYTGVLPNLFREGQTVVVTGKMIKNNLLMASQVLAKHDEKYMPKALAAELKKGDIRAT